MTPRGRRALATLAGLAVVAAHVLALPALLRAVARPDLTVDVDGPPAAPRWSLVGHVDDGLAPRLTIDRDGAPLTSAPPGPGLHYLRFTTRYRGGFTRSVGAVQLVGPFQDPAHLACSARVLVGQRFLDDGHAGPGTVAHTVARALAAQLAGLHQFPVGDFRRVSGVAVQWATFAAHPEDASLLLAADGDGYVRARAVIELDRVSIPIVVALVPHLDGDQLRFAVRVRAQLDFGNRVLDWAKDLANGDHFATRLATDQLDGALIAALGPPPPLALPGGRTLRFTYCGRGPEISDRGFAALPIAVAIVGPTGPAHVLPPALGAAPHPPPPPEATVVLDLDLDAINALLYELWRTGFLDDELAAAGLHRRFNDDPTVQALLSIRLSPLRLALPPVVTAQADRLRLAGEVLVTIHDGPRATLGRVWGGLDFRFHAATATAIGLDVALGPLELTCERGADDAHPRQRVACYADLVAAMRDRAGDVHGALTTTFANILTALFVGQRLGADGVPAELVVRGVRASAIPDAANGLVRLDLDATVAE